VQIAMLLWVRPHLIAPVQVTTAITATNLNGVEQGNGGTVRGMDVTIDQPGAWILSNRTINAAGQAVDTLPPIAANSCRRDPTPPTRQMSRPASPSSPTSATGSW
jgi:hypothetical protein